MILKVVLEKGARMPTRAHKADAGLDLYSKRGYGRFAVEIPPRGSATLNTGVHIEIPEGYVGMVKAKSGMNIKGGITCTGVIDAGYTGSIHVRLQNNSLDQAYTVNPGDKIAQLVILPIITPDLIQVGQLSKTDRGDNGFGSTGVK